MKKASITHIQRNSIHDGPGIRTTVFFKGCNMHCPWCHNPESINSYPELMFFENKCIGCGKCERFLKEKKINLSETAESLKELGKIEYNCSIANICFSKALWPSARLVEMDYLLDEILLDKPFYDISGGGVTLSGGEPMLQAEFILKLLKECKRLNINTAIETNLSVKWELFETILPLTDIFMVDLKLWNRAHHIKYTGVDNEIIIRNLRKLDNFSIPIYLRTPVIQGINDSEAEIESLCNFAASLKNVVSYELLPYHQLGIPKYTALRLKPSQTFKENSSSSIAKLKKIIEEYNFGKQVKPQ
ncbi:glycyl-radical enzyme activating protein [Lentisphaerota bacterium ZTH]|nr:glycyl-radical enzyme activating protein [Lentisphaerota bacterium]WET05910.1 glycyl-radical enzyme activating protein [Lentisphaerota bacterium ZTH]